MAEVTLSEALFVEKNSIDSENPFIILVKIELPDEDKTTIRICYNNQNVEWDGHTWQAFAFQIDEIGETSKGEIPQVTLRVDNTTQAIQRYVEMANGGVGSQVTLYIVHSTHLDEPSVITPKIYEATACSIDRNWAAFTLGAENPFKRRFPRSRVLRGFCRWRFKGSLCQYSGSSNECDKTLASCRNLSNSERFGGFPGIARGGINV